MKVAVDFVTLPREGETENGDAVLVRRFHAGTHAGAQAGAGDGTLIAVLDALGHGKLAAAAATAGIGYLQDAPLERGLRVVVEGLHDRLRGTRGAAAMLLLLAGDHLDGCGVGNVALRAYWGRVPAMLTPGVLGATMPRLRLFQAELSPGDRIVVYTDGITARFDDEASRRAPALEVCSAIMKRHRRTHDDATVLVTDIEAS